MSEYRPLLRFPLYGVILAFSSAAVAAPPVPDDQHALHTPQASTAVLHYESALKTYKPYSDQTVQSWREANELVRSIGGWRAYSREAAAADASESDAPPSPHEHQHGEAQP